jgi:NlpC/P60 family
MLRRVNPVILLGLTMVIALSLALSAGAQSGGGSSGDAVGAAMGQVGKPYVFGTDGPDTFSCAGLVRFALRSAGVDANAPWGHGEYLGAYPNVSSPEPGDVVVYPSGVAMYVGGGTVVMANEADGSVGTYPIDSIGTPVGFARPPYSGAADSAGSDPAMVDPAAVNPATSDPAVPAEEAPAEPLMPVEEAAIEPLVPVEQTVDPPVVDPVAGDSMMATEASGDAAPGSDAPLPTDAPAPL